MLPSHHDLNIEKVMKPIEPNGKFAFCFSDVTWNILVSASGHEVILRGRDKQDYAFGGWADIKTGRIWATNGTIKNVPTEWKSIIQAALENHFRCYFNWM